MTIPSLNGFRHRMGAHCESGTVTSLLNHGGLDVSEAMVFGVAAGMFFGYLTSPMFNFPTFVLRSQPGNIRKKASKRLGTPLKMLRYRRPEKAMADLDALLEKKIPVAVQVDFFYMNYIPPYARAHFNAHYVIVAGREGSDYILSDVYSPVPAKIDGETLTTARFAKGKFAPKGTMFYLASPPGTPDFSKAVRAGIREASFNMLRIPIPFFGVKGIRTFARKVQDWPRIAGDIERLSHEIMMIHVILEERGTGGGGFRFLYATFLQEAAKLMKSDALDGLAKEMMKNGDAWRDISLYVARIGKQRELGPENLRRLSDMLLERAAVEESIFSRLRKALD